MVIDGQNASVVDDVGCLGTGAAHGNRGFMVGTKDGITARARQERSSGYRMDLDTETFVVAEPVSTTEGWTPSNSEGQPHNLVTDVIAFDYRSSGTERSRPVRAGDYSGTLQSGREREAVAFKASHYTRGKDGAPSDVYPPLSADADKGDQDRMISTAMGVRRLTPVECERLQGFPDGWTEFTADGKVIPDSHRYRLMGNAVATVCAQWLGARLVAVDEMMRAQQQQEGTA